MPTVDIYYRNSTDNKFIPNKIDEFNRKEILLTQIRTLLSTRKGEVISALDFGFNQEDYLFENYINDEDMKQELSSQISRYISPFFKEYVIDINVAIMEDGFKLISIVSIFINSILELEVAI